MTIIFVPVAAAWALYWLITQKSKQALLNLAVGVGLGLGIALWFSLPVVMEKQYAHLETLVGGYFDYRAHFVDIERLFISNHWGYGSSGLGQDNDLSLSVGIVQWMIAVLAIILAIVKFKSDKKVAGATLLLGVLSLLTTFMIHQKSSFIWSLLPGFEYIQFPWRFLGVVIFLNSLLSGLCVYFVLQINQKIGFVFGGLSVLLAFLLTVTFFWPKEWYYINDSDKFSGKLWEKQLTISIFDYLPIYAKFPPTKKAPEVPEILEGSVVFKNYSKGSNFQTGDFEVTQPAVLRLPLFDFPGMTVKVNGKSITHTNDDCRNQEFCLGLVTISLAEGNYNLKVKLEDTWVRKISLLISLIAVGLVSWLIIKGNKNDKNKI